MGMHQCLLSILMPITTKPLETSNWMSKKYARSMKEMILMMRSSKSLGKSKRLIMRSQEMLAQVPRGLSLVLMSQAQMMGPPTKKF